MYRRTLLAAGAATPAAMLAATPAAMLTATPALAAEPFPGTINLPTAWRPEGIAILGANAFVGSLADGAIYRAGLESGAGTVFVTGRPGAMAVGLEIDAAERLWVCDGIGGGALVYDANTGRQLAQYHFGGIFINDAVATESAVYFTDSGLPNIFAVPLGPNGELPPASAVQTLPLPPGLGDAGALNNGIEATPQGKLIVVQSNAGRLYSFDPQSGAATQISVVGGTVAMGDGLVRRGRTLYVVRNFANAVAVFRFDPCFATASFVKEITDPRFAIPATADLFGPHLYVVNARFDVEPTPDTAYNVVKVRVL